MTDAGTIILEYVCPTLGCIMGNIMFFAPYRDVKKAVERGSLGDLNPTPWAFMLGNCLGWLAYSFILQNLFIFFANAPGFILSVWLNMCAAKIQYEEHKVREMRTSFVSFLERNQNWNPNQHQQPQEDDDDNETGGGWHNKAVDLGRVVLQVTSQQTPAPAAHETLVVGMVVAWLAVLSVILFGSFSTDTDQLICGIVVNVNLLFFYGAPLSTIFTVLRTHNSATIHIFTMVTNTLNGSFWTAYGIAVSDPFIYVPNGIGALFGLLQFILCLTFPRRPTVMDDHDEEGGQPAVELEGIPAAKEGTLLDEGLSSSQESVVEDLLLQADGEICYQTVKEDANDTK
jgi:solute carrier family 50 protein (sugar transporter)